MAITDKLHNIAEAMREADGLTRTYNLNQMAERPGVWQETIAEAITAKGVDTLPDASFDAMAVNIGLIGGGDCAFLRTEINFSSAFASGDVNFVSNQELINAGIIAASGQLITNLWENYVIVITRDANQAAASASLEKTEATSTPFKRNGTTGAKRMNIRLSNSTITEYYDDSDINVATQAYISQDFDGGIYVRAGMNSRISGKYTIEIYVSGRK